MPAKSFRSPVARLRTKEKKSSRFAPALTRAVMSNCRYRPVPLPERSVSAVWVAGSGAVESRMTRPFDSLCRITRTQTQVSCDRLFDHTYFPSCSGREVARRTVSV